MQAIDPPSSSVSRPGHPEIARLAARLWEERGRPGNADQEIWLEAERRLLKEWRRSQSEAAQSVAAKSSGQKRLRPAPGMAPAAVPERTAKHAGALFI
jgi:hypothetical protein